MDEIKRRDASEDVRLEAQDHLIRSRASLSRLWRMVERAREARHLGQRDYRTLIRRIKLIDQALAHLDTECVEALARQRVQIARPRRARRVSVPITPAQDGPQPVESQ